MKVVLLVSGSGDRFYCQNCHRDLALARALKNLGGDVTLMPMYLPVEAPEAEGVRRAPLHFGALRVSLQQWCPWAARRWPGLLRALDRPGWLRLAARRAGSVEASSLGDMTLSMLRGEHGRQAAELDRLVEWFRQDGPPDVVVLPNALLIGLAPRLRAELGAAVVCQVQDEDVWLDALPPKARAAADREIAAKAAHVDRFIASSRAFALRMQARWSLDSAHVGVAYPVIEPPPGPPPPPPDPPVLGYFARLTADRGLDDVIEAWRLLRREPDLRRLRLRAAGGATETDVRRLRRWERQLASEIAAGEVVFETEYRPDRRSEFYRAISVLSVPSRVEDGGGTQLIEAMAAGVPVVQPARGAFEELVAISGGGRVYEPQTPEGLANALRRWLLHPEELRDARRHAREAAADVFGPGRMAQRWWTEIEAARTSRGGGPI